MFRAVIWSCMLAYFPINVFGSNWDHYSILPQYEIQREKGEISKLSNRTEYCYHFTWMGEKFNNRTFKNIRNKTCSQYFKDKKTLCINPMVATFNGLEPDIDYILEHHPLESTCRLSQGQVCVKYTVTNNGITSYQTRYCSIVNIENEGPMKTGCLAEKRGSEVIEVCVCRSQPGPKGICNTGNELSVYKFLVLNSLFCGLFIFFYGN